MNPTFRCPQPWALGNNGRAAGRFRTLITEVSLNSKITMRHLVRGLHRISEVPLASTVWSFSFSAFVLAFSESRDIADVEAQNVENLAASLFLCM